MATLTRGSPHHSAGSILATDLDPTKALHSGALIFAYGIQVDLS